MLKPLLLFSALLLSAPQQPDAPPVRPPIPPDAAKLANPVKPTAESQAKARKMYGYDCAMCHGANGNGKGEMAADMPVPMKDYTDPAALGGISDGELFYIIRNGKGKMDGEGARLKDPETWNMVLLVRSFAKK